MSQAALFNTIGMKYIEISSDDKLYELLLNYIAKNSIECHSFAASTLPANSKKAGKNEGEESNRVGLTIGFGEFTFFDLKQTKLCAIHKFMGQPVGTNCGAVLFKSLFVYTSETVADLTDFFSTIIAASEKSEVGYVEVYTWNPRRYYWNSKSKFQCRGLKSVVLPQKISKTILSDITHFLSENAKNFYQSHGIPYRRSYLLYGVPGSGKTSLIQAIAGHFNRSISYLQPTHPEMTDDSLANAMDDLNDDTVVVLEDIDALFAKDRSNKVAKSNLTFSGLLNALDGIGSCNGQLVFMTTNLRDQLDPALIRNGRVDFHVHFDYATDEQIEAMWDSYYPDGTEYSQEFRAKLRLSLGLKPIATAGLQHFFVLHMNSSPLEALENVSAIVEDMRQKELDDDSNKDSSEAKPEKKTAMGVAEKGKDKSKVKSKSKDIHIHIHNGSADENASTSDDEEE